MAMKYNNQQSKFDIQDQKMKREAFVLTGEKSANRAMLDTGNF